MVIENIAWKEIPGFDGMYSVSSDGQIRRETASRGFGGTAFPRKVLRQKTGSNGYKSVSLYPVIGKQRHILVHRAVMLAFAGRPTVPTHVVNHKDGNKENNCLDNLEYVSPSENIRHAYATGLARGKKGEENPMAVLNQDTVAAIRTLHSTGWSLSRISRAFRLDLSRVRRIVIGEIWV